MASADVTLGESYEFEADGTIHTATLRKLGGRVRCMHATVAAIVNPNAGAISTTTPPVGDGCIELQAAEKVWTELPRTCKSFTFKASASSTIQYINP